MTLFEIRGLTRDFGGVRAIDGLDLDVDAGEIVSVIGPNGAGKTTLFNLVTGIYRPTSGRIRLRGEDVTGQRPSAYQAAANAGSRAFSSSGPRLVCRRRA